MTRAINFTPVGLSTVPTITGAELLRDSIAQLSGGPEKWAKGDFFVGDGSCALGAITKAGAGKTILYEEYLNVELALLNNLKDMHPELLATTIPELNDDPAVTYEDVMTAFEKTAIQFEEKV